MTFFLTEMGIDPKTHFSKLMFSGSHEASILAVANKEAFAAGGAWLGGFVPADDAKYQIVREINDTAKRLAAQK